MYFPWKFSLNLSAKYAYHQVLATDFEAEYFDEHPLHRIFLNLLLRKMKVNLESFQVKNQKFF